MRLIDADALRASALKSTNSSDFAFDNCFPYWQFSKCIKEAPAIDTAPLTQEEWVIDEFGHKCSGCDEYIPSPEEGETVTDAFCRHCGAKMKGE